MIADMLRRADEIDHAGNKDPGPWSDDLRSWAAALSRLQAERDEARERTHYAEGVAQTNIDRANEAEADLTAARAEIEWLTKKEPK